MAISSQLASPSYVGPWSWEQRWTDWMPEWARADFLVPAHTGPTAWSAAAGIGSAGITAGLVLIALLAYAGWKSKEIRRLWLVVVPLWMLLAIAFQSDSQPRHLLPLIAVVFISLALVVDRLTRRWRLGQSVVAVAAIVSALVMVSWQLASASVYRSEEAAYLSRLGDHAQPGTMLLATGRADPWLAHAETSLPVVYDATYRAEL